MLWADPDSTMKPSEPLPVLRATASLLSIFVPQSVKKGNGQAGSERLNPGRSGGLKLPPQQWIGLTCLSKPGKLDPEEKKHHSMGDLTVAIGLHRGRIQ